jgi:hypothetical protein
VESAQASKPASRLASQRSTSKAGWPTQLRSYKVSSSEDQRATTADGSDIRVCEEERNGECKCDLAEGVVC